MRKTGVRCLVVELAFGSQPFEFDDHDYIIQVPPGPACSNDYKIVWSEARGFGSLPVRVTIGVTTWDTSIFPHTSTGSHLLPLKATVRKAEHIQGGDTVAFSLELRV